MPVLRADNINDMPKKPSPYGDQIARVLVFLLGVGMFLLLVLHR